MGDLKQRGRGITRGAKELVISLFMILTSSHATNLSGENHPPILSRVVSEALLRFITYYTVAKNETDHFSAFFLCVCL